jgi:threonine/homoserine/homoserine lactone efflux protein
MSFRDEVMVEIINVYSILFYVRVALMFVSELTAAGKEENAVVLPRSPQ